MKRLKDRARQYFASVFARITAAKGENPDHTTKVDAEVDTNIKSCTCRQDLEPHTEPNPEPTAAPKKKGKGKEGWKFRPEAEFPWRLEQVVDGEENWRGTWVLEVKDLRAMDWGTERVPKGDGKGRGGRYQRQPTRHMPFPVGGDGRRETLAGGQDDLMVYLGKP